MKNIRLIKMSVRKMIKGNVQVSDYEINWTKSKGVKTESGR